MHVSRMAIFVQMCVCVYDRAHLSAALKGGNLLASDTPPLDADTAHAGRIKKAKRASSSSVRGSRVKAPMYIYGNQTYQLDE